MCQNLWNCLNLFWDHHRKVFHIHRSKKLCEWQTGWHGSRLLSTQYSTSSVAASHWLVPKHTVGVPKQKYRTSSQLVPPVIQLLLSGFSMFSNVWQNKTKINIVYQTSTQQQANTANKRKGSRWWWWSASLPFSLFSSFPSSRYLLLLHNNQHFVQCLWFFLICRFCQNIDNVF